MKAVPAFLVVLAALFTAACSDDSTTAPEAESNKMNATVAGQAWSSTSIAATKGGGQTVVVAQGPNSTVINLNLGSITAPGDYTFGAQIAATYSTGAAAYISTSGTLKITAYDAAHVAGTFNFVGMSVMNGESISVANGSFNAKF